MIRLHIKRPRKPIAKIAALLFIIFLCNLFIGYSMHFSIVAATCMTIDQVQSDSRCLYIWNAQIYEIGSQNNPHHGHSCGTDVTSSVPSSHTDNQSNYLLPNYIANVCANVSPTQTPTPSPTITPTTPALTTAPTPTITPSSGSVTFAVTLLLHGIGQAGDNAKPGSTGNTNPLHPHRTVTVTLLNANSQSAGTVQGTVTYNSSTGNFTGNIIGNNIPSGAYTIQLKADSFLPKTAAGFQQISGGGSITVPSTALVAGDINNDGQLDVSDYNILAGCYGSKQSSSTCISSQGSDLDDDGKVEGSDYNLLLREFSVQKGF